MKEERFSFFFSVFCSRQDVDRFSLILKKKNKKRVFHCGLSVSVAVKRTFQTFFCSSPPETRLIHCSARPAAPPAGDQVQFVAAVCVRV